MKILFFILLGLVTYAFLGYPFLLIVLSRIIPRKVSKKERDDIYVSIIIAAYNEEKTIGAKITNTLQLDYPAENMELIVASDGSTDRTDEIVRSFTDRGVVLNRVEGRKGKTEAQNQTVRIAKGDIVIFSDANALYQRDAVRKIAQNFNDEHVGGVCGNLVYSKSGNQKKNNEIVYWKFENYLKEKESNLSSVLGANGSIYAIRKNLYVSLPPNLISDFVGPLRVVEKGYRVVYEKDAISREDIASVSGIQAFRRKVRINNRTIQGLLYTLKLLNILKYGLVSFQFFSHKILRYLMPFIVMTLFGSNLLILDSSLGLSCLFLQCFFYSLSFIGYMQRLKTKQRKIFSLPWYFVWTHLAIILAWFEFTRGERNVVWEITR